MPTDGIRRENEHGVFTIRGYGELNDSYFIGIEGELNLYGNVYPKYHFHNFVVSRVRRTVGWGLATFKTPSDRVHFTRLGLELVDSLTEDERNTLTLQVLEFQAKYAIEQEEKSAKKLAKMEAKHAEVVRRTNEAVQRKRAFVEGLTTTS